MNKLRSYELAFLLSCIASLTGCQVVGDIFKAGVWVGIILVLVIVFVVIRLLSGGGK